MTCLPVSPGSAESDSWDVINGKREGWSYKDDQPLGLPYIHSGLPYTLSGLPYNHSGLPDFHYAA